MYKVSSSDCFRKVFTQTWKLLMLNLLGMLKERFQVERVELEVVVCLSDGNCLGFTRARSCEDRLFLMEIMGKRELKREWRSRNREGRTAEPLKLEIFKTGIL